MPKLAIVGGTPVRTEPFPEWPRATQATLDRVRQVLESGKWWQEGNGPSEEFEAWLSGYHQTAGAVALTNGTHALEVGLRALSIGPGDEVLVPALTFISTAHAVSNVGAVPIPVDVCEETLGLDFADASTKTDGQTAAAVPVHLAGQPADMDAAMTWKERSGLPLLEDSAQAIGAEWNQRRVGSFGAAGTFSFQASKLLPAGEGGALISTDPALLERCRLISNCGRPRGSPEYSHALVASNFRMSELQAAVLLGQRALFEDLLRERQKTAQTLHRSLDEQGWVRPIAVRPEVTRMVWSLFPFRLGESVTERVSSARFSEALTAEGIPCRPFFPSFHHTECYRQELLRFRDSCPVATRASESVVWLHHRLLLDGERGMQDICDGVEKVCSSLGALAELRQ